MNNIFFEEAFKEAQIAFDNNEVPIGCVIVKNDAIIAKAHNNKESDNCCISHAEINAIQIASKKLNNWRLDDCDIYITLDPCPMCASAIKQARIKNVYSALNNKDDNNLNIIEEIFKKDAVNPSVNFVSNIDIERSKTLLNGFFNKQRNN